MWVNNNIRHVDTRQGGVNNNIRYGDTRQVGVTNNIRHDDTRRFYTDACHVSNMWSK